MKKQEQTLINEKVDTICEEIYQLDMNEPVSEWKRLRTCSAYVCKLSHFYILKSYRTMVAVIDTRTNTCYDFLREVYGYTATSAQHIAKFMHDYGCTERLTWREV